MRGEAEEEEREEEAEVPAFLVLVAFAEEALVAEVGLLVAGEAEEEEVGLERDLEGAEEGLEGVLVSVFLAVEEAVALLWAEGEGEARTRRS